MKHVFAKILLGATVLACLSFAVTSVVRDMTGTPPPTASAAQSAAVHEEEPEPVEEETEPVAVPEPQPQPQPEPEPQPQPQPEPVVEPEPELEPETSPQIEGSYVLNTNTKKIHLPDCSSVKSMKEKNRQDYTGTLEGLLEQGYEPCGRCKP